MARRRSSSTNGNGVAPRRRSNRKKGFANFRKYFAAGILVLAPLALTYWILRWLVNTADSLLTIEHGKFFFAIPETFHPDHLLGFHVPGLGVVLAVSVVLIAGLLASNVLGKRLIHIGESLVGRIPFINTVYKSFKQVFGTVFAEGSRNFREVVLVEFPRKGQYSIGFITGDSFHAAQVHFKEKMTSVFVPTTPNPTSGFYFMVSNDELIPLSITTEEAFKLIMSFGIIAPETLNSVIAGKTGNP